MLGIDAEQMSHFIEHTADLLMQTFKQPAIYQVTQPFEWMTRKEVAMPTSSAAQSTVSPTAAKAAAMGAPGSGGMAMDQVSACVRSVDMLATHARSSCPTRQSWTQPNPHLTPCSCGGIWLPCT